MRNVCFRAMTLATMVAGMLFLSSRAPAQMVQTLVDFTSTWKYDASGTELGTAWRTNTFNDTAWPSGQGLLGLEPDNPGSYPAPFNTALTVPTPITHYFRIHFNFAAVTNGVTLIASNVVDDGCVIYLNGREAGRLRVPANQNSTTSASGGPATEGAIEVITFPNGLLRQGDNVLAVEVHQSGTGSSDVAWGTRLVASVPAMLSITSQPQSQTVQVGESASFSVGVSGGPITYFWQKETSPGSGTFSTIPGSNTNTYTISNVQVANAGNYRVVVSNAVNSVISAVAALTVSSDTTPPTMLSAIVREVITGPVTNSVTNFNQIDITFDESLTLATAANVANYVLKRYDNDAIIPLRSAANNGSLVRLTIETNPFPANWIYRTNYYITVSNVTDSRGNAILPGSTIGVSWRIPIEFMQMSDEWSFYDLAFFNDTNLYSSTAWTRTNYVETTAGGWVLASDPLNVGGIYWRDPNNQAVTCAGDVLNNQISFQMPPTLFRRRFTVPSNLTSATFQLRYIIDDGAIFYLNGQEIHRYNMQAAPFSFGSRAQSLIANPTCNTNVAPINVTLFPGTNWFAVAVCQSVNDDTANDGADTIFGLEIGGFYLQTSPAPPPPLPPPHLYITRSGGNTVLTWSNATGYVLQSATNLLGSSWKTNGTWTTVPGAASGYSTPLSGASRFFRLQHP